MTVEIIGAPTQKRGLSHCCAIKTRTDNFTSCVCGKNREISVFDQSDNRVYYSSYVCRSLIDSFLDRGAYRFYNKNDEEIFSIIRKGIFPVSTILSFEGQEIKVPYRSSFVLEAIGYEIVKQGKKFTGIIDRDDEKYISLALLLSYFVWVRQEYLD